MDIKDLNEPAFPRVVNGIAGETKEVWYGMTLRDYFAAKAMAPMVHNRMTGSAHYGNEQDIAMRAYEIADAMLAERAK